MFRVTYKKVGFIANDVGLWDKIPAKWFPGTLVDIAMDTRQYPTMARIIDVKRV